ncbi:MAG: virulence factor SrfB [Symbiopectobacterium sp.]
MLCLLAMAHSLLGFYFKAGDFEPYSTIRYFGMHDRCQPTVNAG